MNFSVKKKIIIDKLVHIKDTRRCSFGFFFLIYFAFHIHFVYTRSSRQTRFVMNVMSYAHLWCENFPAPSIQFEMNLYVFRFPSDWMNTQDEKWLHLCSVQCTQIEMTDMTVRKNGNDDMCLLTHLWHLWQASFHSSYLNVFTMW